MSDQEIIDFFINKERNAIIPARTNKNFIEKHKEIAEYLKNRFKEPYKNYAEIISRIYYGIEEKPKCRICGNYKPYKTFKQPYTDSPWCSTNCQLRDPIFIKERVKHFDFAEIKRKRQETLERKYGNKFYRNLEKAKQTLMEKYGVDSSFKGCLREKINKTIKERYGVENPFQVQEFCEKAKKTKLERYGDSHYTNKNKRETTMIERYGAKTTLESPELIKKVAQTKLERYGKADYVNVKKITQTCMERYGVPTYLMTKDVRDKIDYKKIAETKRQNHTFNSSKQEDKAEKVLQDMFGADNVVRSYRDDRYKRPSDGYRYECDFYVKNLDLFIEIQGHYTHGDHPFNDNNKKDILHLEELKQSDKPSLRHEAKVWGCYDVNKRTIAHANNLKYVEIFGSHRTEKDLRRLLTQEIQKVLANYEN